MLYRKKPVVIEAVRIPPEIQTSLEPEYEAVIQKIADWCGGELFRARGLDASPAAYIAITTLEGTMKADPGDWIIKGVKGEFYPCNPDIFEATYEAVSTTPAVTA